MRLITRAEERVLRVVRRLTRPTHADVAVELGHSHEYVYDLSRSLVAAGILVVHPGGGLEATGAPYGLRTNGKRPVAESGVPFARGWMLTGPGERRDCQLYEICIDAAGSGSGPAHCPTDCRAWVAPDRSRDIDAVAMARRGGGATMPEGTGWGRR